MKQKKLLMLIAMVLVVVLCASVLTACKKDKDKGGKGETPAPEDNYIFNFNDGHEYVYKTYESSFATSWNVHTTQTDAQSNMYANAVSGFYEFDYKFDENDMVVDGEFSIIPVMASAFPTDVTGEFVGDEWGIAAGSDSRAWYIPIRKGMTWDDGTPINPEDWVYSMEQQLNPKMLNHRADSYYAGSVVLHNAQNYLFQGQEKWFAASDVIKEYDSSLDSKLIFNNSNSKANKDNDGAINGIRKAWKVPESYNAATMVKLMNANGANASEQVLAKMEGKTIAEIKADAEMNAELEKLVKWWDEGENGVLAFCLNYYKYPVLSFDKVGIKAVNDGNRYGIIIILDKPLNDSDSHFTWAYDFGGNWLVKRDVYEKCKVNPTTEGGLVTSTYGTSPETSPSYGPYKLTEYQLGKSYKFERNNNWFGYRVRALSEGMYQADAIQCTLIDKWQTAWLSFQKGELSAIGMDVSIANEYKTSKYAYFTPDDYVSTMQLQSTMEIKSDDGNARELLMNTKFRKALSLAIDRVAYAQQITTSSLAGFGLFNSMHYYDVENGKVYRNTDIAKRVICETYGVNIADYASLDEAYEAVTGYDLAQARALVIEAINEEVAAGNIKKGDKLALKYITSVDNENSRRPMNFLQAAWAKLFEGTDLEGKLVIEMDGTAGDAYATQFQAGNGDILMAGWSGAAWDPFWFITAYLADQYRYAQGWDPKDTSLTITIPGAGENGADLTDTMNILDWYDCVNGNDGAKYDFGEGKLEMEKRLIILGAMEKCVLETYYSVPITYYFSAALRSKQIEFFTDTYSTFMGWGSIKYYSFNYDEVEWAQYVVECGGTIEYK